MQKSSFVFGRVFGVSNKKTFLVLDLLLLAAFAIPALLPLFAPGNLQGADATDPPWRSIALRLAFGDRILFPRWTPEFFYGYGFPCFHFYAPLSFYPAMVIEAVTWFDYLESTKVAYAISFALAGVGAYVLTRQLTSHRSAALLAGVLYMYAPYLLGEIYERSSLAGLSGLTLVPFVLAVFVRLCQRPAPRDVGLAAVLLAALALTHNVTCLLACGMVAGFVALHFLISRDTESLVLATLAMMLGLGAASFFWLPAVVEKEYVHTESLNSNRNDPRIHLVDPLGNVNDAVHSRGWWDDYKLTKWGPIDLHPAYPYGSPPYKISLFQGVLFLFCGFALAVNRRRPNHMVFLFIIALLLFFVHTTWSQWVWDTFPFLVLISYPWRVTGPIGLCLAVVGAWAMRSAISERRLWLMLPVAVSAILTGVWDLPTQLGPFENGMQVTRENLIRHEYYHRTRFGTWADFLMLPLSVQWENISGQDVIIRYDQSFPPANWVADAAFVAPDSKAQILSARRGQEWMEAHVEAVEPTLVAFHTIYFPGWTAYLDGQKVPVEPSSWQEYEHNRKAALGVCQVLVPEGKHHVAMVFEDTPVRLWSERAAALCILGIGVVFLVSIWSRGSFGRSRMSKGKFTMAVVLGIVIGLAAYLVFMASAKTPAWVKNRIVSNLIEQIQTEEPEDLATRIQLFS